MSCRDVRRIGIRMVLRSYTAYVYRPAIAANGNASRVVFVRPAPAWASVKVSFYCNYCTAFTTTISTINTYLLSVRN